MPPKPENFVSFAAALRAAALIGSPLCEICGIAPGKLMIGNENDGMDSRT